MRKGLYTYIFRHLLSLFLTVNVLIFAFFMGLRILKMSYAILLGVPVETLMKITVLLLSPLSTTLFPISLYITVYLVAARMREDREVVVLETLGFRVKNLIVPFALFTASVFTFMLVNLIFIEPFANSALKKEVGGVKSSLKISFRKGSFLDLFREAVMYVGDEENGVLKDVFVNLKREGKDIIITATQGSLRSLPSGGYEFSLSNGHMEIKKGQVLELVDFRSLRFKVEPSGLFSPKKLFTLKKKEMDIFSLRKAIKEARKKGDLEEVEDLENALYLKLSVVFSVIPLLFMAFSIGTGRLPWSFISGAKGLLVFLVLYYGSFSALQGHKGHIPIWLSCFLPNLVFLGVGLFLFLSLKE